ncbi:MAG TPA: hypothetical protein VF803_00210, partial [Candidatus Paceibacterota bacterium]
TTVCIYQSIAKLDCPWSIDNELGDNDPRHEHAERHGYDKHKILLTEAIKTPERIGYGQQYEIEEREAFHALVPEVLAHLSGQS